MVSRSSSDTYFHIGFFVGPEPVDGGFILGKVLVFGGAEEDMVDDEGEEEGDAVVVVVLVEVVVVVGQLVPYKSQSVPATAGTKTTGAAEV